MPDYLKNFSIMCLQSGCQVCLYNIKIANDKVGYHVPPHKDGPQIVLPKQEHCVCIAKVVSGGIFYKQ